MMDSPPTGALGSSPGLLLSPVSSAESIQLPTPSRPLERFRAAKSGIQAIFERILRTLEDTNVLLIRRPIWVEQCPGQKPVIHEELLEDELQAVKDAIHNASSVVETVQRDAMKAVVFGRTSTGKSTLINAMLNRKILPSGVGHTTSCFCRIVGIDSTSGSPTKASVQGADGAIHGLGDLKQLAHALFSTEDFRETVTVRWPREKCKLLRDYVEILDSPGLDVDEQYDDWIDRHCKDADILVLVANAEAALNLTEQKFLEQVHMKVAHPTVFICFNRWDAIDDEFDGTPADGVKTQHLDRAFSLLVERLELVDSGRINDRVFLISAREALQRRTGGGSVDANGGIVGDSHKNQRYSEFERFESLFEECLSFNAIEKRFETHTRDGLQMTRDIASLLSQYAQRLSAYRKRVGTYVLSRERERDQLQSRVVAVGDHCRNAVNTYVDNVSSDMVEMLNTMGSGLLTTAIQGFRSQRNAFDARNLETYERNVRLHINEAVKTALSERCRQEVVTAHDALQTEIGTALHQLVPAAMRIHALDQTEYNAYVPVNTDTLTDTFHADLSFRFSLGFATLGPKLFALYRGGVAQRLAEVGLQTLASGDTDTHPPAPGPSTAGKEVAASRPSEHGVSAALSFLATPTGVLVASTGMALVTPLRTRVLVYGMLLYGGLYMYERAAYTKAAQIHRYKTQLIAHTTRKLEDLAPHIVFYCLEDLRKAMLREVDASLDEIHAMAVAMETDIAENQQRVHDLSELETAAHSLKARMDDHGRDVRSFLDEYMGGTHGA
eukprot:m.1086806 g.1086806  ORF g.1086806 m.1086806 type:complete len:782 (-) comp24280_c0_seq24:1608-3953(-)